METYFPCKGAGAARLTIYMHAQNTYAQKCAARSLKVGIHPNNEQGKMQQLVIIS